VLIKIKKNISLNRINSERFNKFTVFKTLLDSVLDMGGFYPVLILGAV
jgi:hypothetical protein